MLSVQPGLAGGQSRVTNLRAATASVSKTAQSESGVEETVEAVVEPAGDRRWRFPDAYKGCMCGCGARSR